MAEDDSMFAAVLISCKMSYLAADFELYVTLPSIYVQSCSAAEKGCDNYSVYVLGLKI